MSNIVLLFICLLIGVGLRTFRRAPENAHVAINAFIIHVSLPALVLVQIHNVQFSFAILSAAAMPWMLFALSASAFAIVARVLKIPATTTGALIMTAGLGNTSFVGLPMIEAFYGPGGLQTGILIDQLGTYLVLSTLGITVACIYSGGTASARDLLKKIVTFPPLIALIVALILSTVDYPAWLSSALRRLGDTLAPLALVSVGLQLRLGDVRENKANLSMGLAFKLILAPALLALFYLGWFSDRGETAQVTLFEAAMGPQIGGGIVAIQYGLNPALVSLMVGVGISLSFATLPVWWYVLQHV